MPVGAREWWYKSEQARATAWDGDSGEGEARGKERGRLSDSPGESQLCASGMGYDPGIPRVMGQHGPTAWGARATLKRSTVIVMGQPVGL